jgi:hypothetical protein
MQALWQGDRRDRVKWGALFYLAVREEIPIIAQIAFLRKTATLNLEITIPGQSILRQPIQETVLNHFSGLGRISRLNVTGVHAIRVFTEIWSVQRGAYIAAAVHWLAQLRGRKLVFLDPDTGLAPRSGGDLAHVRTEEIEQLWTTLNAKDWLALYQHAAHNTDWLDERSAAFSEACGVAACEIIQGAAPAARDVAIFAIMRP